MKLLWPAGVAGRVAMLLALSLLAVQLVSIPYYLSEQARSATEIFEQSTSARIASITRLLDGLDSERRRQLLPSLSSPSLRVELLYQLPPAPQGAKSVAQTLVQQLAIELRRPLQVRRYQRAENDDVTLLSGLFASRELISIWAPLEDDTWLRFVTASALPSLGWIAHISAQILLVSLAVIAFALWAARQITRPIRAFAAAAERLGRDVNAAPMAQGGSPELRQAAQAFNAMQFSLQRYIEDRTRMLAAISHDLRTSLTRLRLRLQFIDDAEQQRKAEKDLEDMEAMLAATLAFSREDAAEEEQVPLDIAALAQSLCDDLGDSGHPIDYQGPTALAFRCRPLALQRALANILANAAGYGEGGVVVLHRSADGLDITVSDRGPGIPEAELERVFEPFVRLETARPRATGGTGLGLPIARSVIHAHGGSISLSNREAGGLRVQIHLPN